MNSISSPSLSVHRGRFAPSPTGPLHFGSLVAALGSYLDARTKGGEWLVRMEDVDLPRCLPGAADDILRTLDAFGFEWDGPVLYQSMRGEAYAAALASLVENGLAYGCACSRREISDSSTHSAIDGGLVYPGTCRAGLANGSLARAWRLRVDNAALGFDDRLQGPIIQHLEQDVGDFVLRRADGLFAYQLAVTVDDNFQGISSIVRGADLLASTPRQLWLQNCLGMSRPQYGHLPVVVNAAGEKLSKQTLAPPLEKNAAVALLVAALSFLGQPVPRALVRSTVGEIWAWAMTHWSFAAIPRQATLSAPPL